MTNATIANELRDAITGSLSWHDRQTLNNKALDVAVHEASTAWHGEGSYQLKSVVWGAETTNGGWYSSAVDLAWEAFIETSDIAAAGDVFAAFSVDFEGDF